MTFNRFMTFAAPVALVFVSLHSSSVDAAIYFSDNFENPGESATKWEVIAGDWQVADGVYHQLSTASPWQASMVAADKWNDEWQEYTIEFMVKPLTPGDAPVNVLFRVQDPVPQVWADRNGPNTHVYRWIVNGWTNTESRVYMYNAGTSVMLTQKSNSLVVGNWHHIKLVVTKTGFAGYVDDVEMCNAEHAQWTNGRVGLHAYNGMMDFDDFSVYGPGGEGLQKASRPDPADGALHPNTWVSLSWRAGPKAVSHDVYLGDNFDDVNSGAGSTFRGNQAPTTLLVGLGLPGDPYPAGLVPGTTYYWRIDEVNIAEPNSPWKGAVWSFSIPPRTAYFPTPADGAEAVALNASLSWTGGYGSKLHTAYFGDSFDDVNSATTGAMSGSTTYNPGPLQRQKVYYWRVDEFDGAATYKGQVWSFATLGAVGNPYPANGAPSAEMNAILTWTPSDNAASHQVYFGTDKEALRKADTASPEYKGVKALGAESYDPGLLAWDSTYYWRIDEVNSTNAASPWKGPLWSFTTGDFLLVDGFESYNDIDPPDPKSNRIFDKWIDGFGTTTNGAVVGNNLPPYAERTVIHGGAQSMPYAYDTNLKFSEATLTLASTRNWTAQGVTSLSLWFRGASANAAVRMYVALNGSAVVYHDNPSVAKTSGWTQWVIPLQAFADQGVNLANMTGITIGFGTKGTTTVAGGTGKMYFDDIRLYRPRP